MLAKAGLDSVPALFHIFAVRVTEQWHRLPREVVETPSFILEYLLDIQKPTGRGQLALGGPA